MGSAADSGGQTATAVLPRLAAARGASSLAVLLRESWPAWIVAWSLNGFFVYLAVLDALDIEPRTPITGTYYAVLGTALLVVAWRNRAVLAVRAESSGRRGIVYAIAAAVLVTVFVGNVAVLSEGSQPRKFAALLVGWSLPTAIAAASLSVPLLRRLTQGLVVLGAAFVAIEVVAASMLDGDVARFSPISDLDPINAGLVPALGAVAVLTIVPTTGRTALLQLTLYTALAAAAVLPGSRGPLVALVVGSLVALATRPGRFTFVAVPCLAVGLAIGLSLSTAVGSYDYLTVELPDSSPAPPTAVEPEPISTLSIRRQWFVEAVSSAADRPLFGHGVGMLIDDTPEAVRMGVAGQRTYPHNTFAEAAFSLGLLGTVPFLALLGAGGWALLTSLRGSRAGPPGLVAVLGSFAFATTNVSGEIGTDALLWTASALAVAVYADSRRTPSSGLPDPR